MGIFRDSKGDKRDDLDDPSTRKISREFNFPPEPSFIPPPPPPVSADKTAQPPPPVESSEPKTRVLFKRQQQPSDSTIIPAGGKADDQDVMADPVVGWIVVVKGPGRGHALSLGYGMNSVGRGNTERVCLDFGDTDISRASHAIITYDPRGRKFYVQHGGGKNLTYLNNAPLLMPTQMFGGEHILLGQTTLRFVPLCGENFDWQEQTDTP
jgi:hypothetical protein